MGARRMAAGAIVVVGLVTVPAARAQEGSDGQVNPLTRDAVTYVFNGEGNNLNAYDTLTWEKQRVITNASQVPYEQGGRDINAQICFDPFARDGYFFIAGEDTGQEHTSVGGGQGWGYFELHVERDTLDILGATQRGKLAPRFYETTSDNPENYGCGFLANGDLVTSDVGDQFPQDPATGELILWFRPEGGFATGRAADGSWPSIPYCKIDVHIPTAGQVLVDEQDRVYVGAQRPDLAGGNVVERPGGIYRYTPPDGGWPTSPDECTGRHEKGEFVGENADPMVTGYGFDVFIPMGPWGLTPSGIVRVPEGLPNAGNFYLSSVFDGRISEFDAEGNFVRFIMAPEPGELPPYRETGTPLGIGVDPHTGTIYFADIAITVSTGVEDAVAGLLEGDPGALAEIGPGIGPGPDGMVRAIRFDEGQPGESIPVNGGLAFPDGIGIVTVERAGLAGPGDRAVDDRPAPVSAPSSPLPANPAGVLPATGSRAVVPVLAALGLGLVLGRRRREREVR